MTALAVGRTFEERAANGNSGSILVIRYLPMSVEGRLLHLGKSFRAPPATAREGGNREDRLRSGLSRIPGVPQVRAKVRSALLGNRTASIRADPAEYLTKGVYGRRAGVILATTTLD